MRIIPSLLLLLGWLHLPVEACQICLPFPVKSLADHLVEADKVVLARENPEKPFSLIATEALKGDGELSAIDLFLDSHSRRVLENDATKGIVCILTQGEWKRVATSDPILGPIIHEIIAKEPDWEASPDQRPDFFAPYLDHPERQVALLAHLEVARAPYSKIRTLSDAIPIERLRAFLGDFRYAEWHALYILLLAQSDDPGDRKRIVDSMKSNARFSIVLQSAAWATAYIEIEESEAIEFLRRDYFDGPNRRPDEINAILAAFSVHGTNGHTHLRDEIVEAYRSLAERHPDQLPAIVKDLTKWQRWDLADLVLKRLTTSPGTDDLTTTVELRNYLRLADQVSKETSDPASPSRQLLWILPALILLPLAFKLSGFRSA
ncbi:MAG: hypothetical protein AAGI48_04790 [Verrucomicrobiota bacterium]